MKQDATNCGEGGRAFADIHENDPRFVEYYTKASATDEARQRALAIMKSVQRVREQQGATRDNLQVADIGCNAGTQSQCWLEQGHTIFGVDISRELIDVARTRCGSFGDRARFFVGTATSLPWPEDSFDVCLLPELLEHVEDWQGCLREAV